MTRITRPTLRRLFVGSVLAALPVAGGACTTSSHGGTPGTPGSGTNGDDTSQTQSPLAPPDKLDLLFMVDNSASMGDKQAILANTASQLLDRFVNPRCIDASGTVVGPSQDGHCDQGEPEFPSIHDIHVGIVTSSLGGQGGDACSGNILNHPTHDDDKGHLVTRSGADEHADPDAPAGFLAWFPAKGNEGKTPPANAITDEQTLAKDFADQVTGVHEFGCGFEAQLESWYRFLVQPDPYDTLTVDATGVAKMTGVDEVLLKQRHDFLRPDSLVAVILITDENDSAVDPMAVGGQGWAFENDTFPASTTAGGAPKGTSACASNPNDASCTSCAFCLNGGPSAICDDPTCKAGGYYEAVDDPLNLRLFHMKQRFGVDAQFPIARYVDGLTSPLVPNRDGEHPSADGRPSASYVGEKTCTNPLFAKNLPTSATDELCHLDASNLRTPEMVLFGVIGGVPWQLVATDPTSPRSADKASLTDDEWTAIIGKDPLDYDFTGADPHMIESSTPRTGLPGPTTSDSADPMTGREWNTNGHDLEYACVFDLPAPRDCTQPDLATSCDCTNDGTNPPICDRVTPTTQIRGRAYPTIREFAVARALGANAIVSSICPRPVAAPTTAFSYSPAVDSIAARLRVVYAARKN